MWMNARKFWANRPYRVAMRPKCLRGPRGENEKQPPAAATRVD